MEKGERDQFLCLSIPSPYRFHLSVFLFFVFFVSFVDNVRLTFRETFPK
jgi:hypothetical protein